MKRSFKLSRKKSSKRMEIQPKRVHTRRDSLESSDTQELIRKSLDMVNELSSFLDKDTSNGEVDGPSNVGRCDVTPRASSYRTRRSNSLRDVLDTQSIGTNISRNPDLVLHDEPISINSEDQHQFRATCKKHSNGFTIRAVTASKLARCSRGGRSQSNDLDSQTSGEESIDDDDDDDDIELCFQGTRSEICNLKDSKVGDVSHEMVRSILQCFQIISERCSQARALKILKRKFKCLEDSKKYLGSVPGVEVGDFYYNKSELSIVGLHHDLSASIECTEHDGVTVATSIVTSGYHVDDVDISGALIYPGSEGYSGYSLKNGRLSIDRKLEVGILALKNSIETCTPVRVIFCLREEEGSLSNKSKKVAAYIYNGLYMVEKYWFVSRGDGFSTYNFQLRRKSGQQQFNIEELWMSRPLKMRFGLRMEDISEGKEKKPVSVVNTIDDDLPTSFTYITEMIYSSQHKMKPAKGCDCKNGCSDLVKCACMIKNGGDFPFNCQGGIIRAKPLVYECGPSCMCPPSCDNRVSQLGFEYRLEIFKTKSRGWGVRTLERIPTGSLICEYIGEMLEDTEAGKRDNDEYLFDIGRNYHDKSLWDGLSSVPIPKKDRKKLKSKRFTIDAAVFGNVGRFINHSCTPNLYAQNVLYDHDDAGVPHIMFFSTEDIFPYEELTYHYNYQIDGVRGSDGKIMRKDCHCGSIECTGRLY